MRRIGTLQSETDLKADLILQRGTHSRKLPSPFTYPKASVCVQMPFRWPYLPERYCRKQYKMIFHLSPHQGQFALSA
jgi:hypothetical protein